MLTLGVFHYRLKVQGKHLPRSSNIIDEQGFVWLDISGRNCNSYEEIDTHSEPIVEIQLLILQVPSISYDIHHRYDSVDLFLHSGHDDDGVDEDEELMERYYMEELNYRIPSPADRLDTSGITYNGAIDSSSSSSSYRTKHSGSLKSSLRHVRTAASTINLSHVMSNASMVWSKVKATAASIQQETKILTDTIFQANNNDDVDVDDSEIDQLHRDLLSPFRDGTTSHIQLLFDLWDIQVLPIRSMPYERVSAGWKAAGWQKEDPVMELKSTGLLALQSMVYVGRSEDHDDDDDDDDIDDDDIDDDDDDDDDIDDDDIDDIDDDDHYDIDDDDIDDVGEHYKDRNLHMLRSNEASKPTHYPYAIVGVNITLMLVELLRLRDLLSAKKGERCFDGGCCDGDYDEKMTKIMMKKTKRLLLMMLLMMKMKMKDDDDNSQVEPHNHPYTTAYCLTPDPCLSSLLRESNVFYEVRENT